MEYSGYQGIYSNTALYTLVWWQRRKLLWVRALKSQHNQPVIINNFVMYFYKPNPGWFILPQYVTKWTKAIPEQLTMEIYELNWCWWWSQMNWPLAGPLPSPPLAPGHQPELVPAHCAAFCVECKPLCWNANRLFPSNHSCVYSWLVFYATMMNTSLIPFTSRAWLKWRLEWAGHETHSKAIGEWLKSLVQ